MSVHVMITGRVQGVGFRAWTAATARTLQLSGWVRNRREGAVEAVFAGSQAAVEVMLEACGEGPPAARVDAVQVSSLALGEEIPSGFTTRETC